MHRRLCPLLAPVMAHASVEMEHPIAIGTAQAHLSIADQRTVTGSPYPQYGTL